MACNSPKNCGVPTQEWRGTNQSTVWYLPKEAVCYTYSIPTQECRANVFGYLVAGLARLCEVTQFSIQHPFELFTNEQNKYLIIKTRQELYEKIRHHMRVCVYLQI